MNALAPSAARARADLEGVLATYSRLAEGGDAYGQLRRARALAPDTAERNASVLVLFGALDAVPASYRAQRVPAELDLLFLLRASTLRNHAGEIAFPGGGADPEDANEVATALREAQEETGLDPEGVDVLGVLPVAPTVSRFAVTPVLGWWSHPSPVGVVDTGESAAVFRAPVADLIDPAKRCQTVLRRGGQEWVMPAFRVEHGLLWGFTAGIVSSLLDQLGWAEDWDHSDWVTPPGF